MAILSITEAAALAGVSRGTLYNRFRDGELSRSGEGIDTTELLRVFGPFNSPPVSTTSTDATEPPDDVTTRPLTPFDERIVQRLDEQLAAAERERAGRCRAGTCRDQGPPACRAGYIRIKVRNATWTIRLETARNRR